MGKWSGRNTLERRDCPLNQFGNSYEHFENRMERAPHACSRLAVSRRCFARRHSAVTTTLPYKLFLSDQSLFQLWVRRIFPNPNANQLMTKRLVAHLPRFLPANHHLHAIAQKMESERLAFFHVLEQTLQLRDAGLELRATGDAIFVEPFLERVGHLFRADIDR